MLWACFAEQRWTVGNAFAKTSAAMHWLLGHCPLVWAASLHRCICSDTTKLWASFAQQLWTVVNAIAKTSAAVHWWWISAHLCEQQIFIGVIAVTQACCEPVLQGSTGQWGMQFAKTRAAVLWWWISAHLYEQQIIIGVIAATQACCEPVLQSSTGQWGMHLP